MEEEKDTTAEGTDSCSMVLQEERREGIRDGRRKEREKEKSSCSSGGVDERTRDGWRTHVDYRMGQGESVWRTTAGQPGHLGGFFYLYASLTAGAAAVGYCFILYLFLAPFLPLLGLFEAIFDPVRCCTVTSRQTPVFISCDWRDMVILPSRQYQSRDVTNPTWASSSSQSGQLIFHLSKHAWIAATGLQEDSYSHGDSPPDPGMFSSSRSHALVYAPILTLSQGSYPCAKCSSRDAQVQSRGCQRGTRPRSGRVFHRCS